MYTTDRLLQRRHICKGFERYPWLVVVRRGTYIVTQASTHPLVTLASCRVVKKDEDIVISDLTATGVGALRALLRFVKEADFGAPVYFAVSATAEKAEKLEKVYSKFGIEKFATIYKVK